MGEAHVDVLDVDTDAATSADAPANRDPQLLEGMLGAEGVFTLYRVSKLVSASLDLDATLQRSPTTGQTGNRVCDRLGAQI